MTSRRQFFRLTAGGLVALGGVPPRPRPAWAQLPTVKIGTAVLGDYGLVAPIAVALEKGYFKAHGVTAEFQPFRGGPDLVKAVVANQIQVGVTGATDVPVFRAEGVPIRYVATIVDGNQFTFNVAPGISKLAELKGKSIGVTRAGATTWVFAVMLARQQGWNPQRDVNIVGLGGIDAQLAALARGEIQAFIWGDGGAVAERQGKSKILLRLDSVTPKWISEAAYGTDEAIKSQKATIAAALKGYFQGVKFIRETPKEAHAIAAKTLGWPEDAVARAYEITGPLFSKDGVINVEAIDVMQATMVELKAQKQKMPTAELYTTDFTPIRL
jgi:ABC-type nitrate/sulfonate/bicarbonate transport system substrate-binding protein